MNTEPDIIASLILANSATVSKLQESPLSDLRIELWHIVADISGKRYLDAPVGTPMPDINALTDAIYPLVAAALGNSARSA